jgi:hypothetical protein
MQRFLTPLVQKLLQLESTPTPARGENGTLMIRTVVLTMVMDLRGKVFNKFQIFILIKI